MPDLPDEEEPTAAVVAPAPVVVHAPVAPGPRAISDEVWGRVTSTWVNDNLRSSPVSQSTEGWNHLMSAIPRLRELLEAELA